MDTDKGNMDTYKEHDKIPPHTPRQGGGRQPGTRTVQGDQGTVKETSPQDNEQGLRWLDFLAQQPEVGDNLLKGMELIEQEQDSDRLTGDDQ
jgi:hypothetical protein